MLECGFSMTRIRVRENPYCRLFYAVVIDKNLVEENNFHFLEGKLSYIGVASATW